MPDGAARELAGEPDVFAEQKSHATRINDEITVDVLPVVAGVPWEALHQYVRTIAIDDMNLRVLRLEGLLQTKSGARPKDQMDAADIAQVLENMGRR